MAETNEQTEAGTSKRTVSVVFDTLARIRELSKEIARRECVLGEVDNALASCSHARDLTIYRPEESGKMVHHINASRTRDRREFIAKTENLRRELRELREAQRTKKEPEGSAHVVQ